MSVRRTVASVAVLSMGILPLAACSSDGDADASGSSQSQTSDTLAPTGTSSESAAPETTSSEDTPTEETTPSTTEETEETAESAADETTDSAADETTGSPADETTESAADESSKDSAKGGATPAWGYPGTSTGTKIGTVKNDSVAIDVYQVKVVKSPKSSLLADAKTKKPLIQKGDKIVWVNYVVKNISDKPIDLGASLVSIQAKYPDWQYLGGMASITDSAMADKLGVHTFGIKPNSGDKPYVFAPGESYVAGENFLYEGPKELDLKVTVTPVDAKGDLDHDKSVKFEGSVKIK